MAGNIVIGTLRTLLTADASDYKSGLGEAEKQTDAFSSTVSGLGKTIAAAFSLRDVAAGVADVVDSAGKIADVAEKLGVGAEAVQRLSFAAEQGGASMETVAGAMAKMSDNIAVGGKGTAAALDAIGLSVETLKGMAPDQAFAAIADAIQKVPDPMQQTALAMDLFGKKGVELLPAIKAGITEVGNQAPVMSAHVVAAGAKAGDTWDAQQAKMQALRAEALGPLIQGFLALPGSVQTAAAGFAAFAPSLETITAAVIGMGGPVAAFGQLKAAGMAVAGFFSMSGGMGAVIAFFTTTLPGAIGTVLAFLGPQGIIAVAVLALAAIWYFFGDEITAVVTAVYDACKKWLLDKLQPLFDLVEKALQALNIAWVLAKEAVIGVVTALYAAVQEWIVDKVLALFDRAKAGLDVYLGFWTAAFNLVVGVVTTIYKAIKEWVVDKVAALWTLFKAGLDVYIGLFTTAKDTVVGIVTALYTGVKTWLVDKFQAIVNGVKAPIDAVTGLFGGMKDAVVGHSFVPDMVRDIGTEFGKLTKNMLDPTKLVTSGVTSLFQTMGVDVSGVVGSLLESLGKMLGGWLSSKLPSFVQQMSSSLASGAASAASTAASIMSSALSAGVAGAVQIGLDLAQQGISALIGHLQGGEVGREVNPARDAFFSQFVAREGGTPFEAMAAAFGNAGVSGDVAERLIGMLYDAESMSQLDVAISEIRRLLPDYRTGTGGFTDFGSGTLAMLHGREAVVPDDAASAFAERFGDDRTQVIHIYQDGFLTATRVVQHMPRVLALHGVG